MSVANKAILKTFNTPQKRYIRMERQRVQWVTENNPEISSLMAASTPTSQSSGTKQTVGEDALSFIWDCSSPATKKKTKLMMKGKLRENDTELKYDTEGLNATFRNTVGINLSNSVSERVVLSKPSNLQIELQHFFLREERSK